MDTRAVSETLGYVLLTSVVLISIGAVALMGAPVIQDQQEAEYVSNTVRAFEVFGNNIDAIERNRAPARETEMQYQGGTLFQSEDFYMEVEVSHAGATETYLFAGTPLSYEKGDSSIHYESGSIIRQDGSAGTMVSEPPLEFSDERVRMSVITTSVLQQEQTLQGSGKVAIIARSIGSQTHAITGQDSGEDVHLEITITSPRYETWKEYFEQEGLTVERVDHSTGEVQVSFTSDEVAVRETLIQIDARS